VTEAIKKQNQIKEKGTTTNEMAKKKHRRRPF